MPRVNNTKFYNLSLQHKNHAKAVHWNSKDTQEIRFQILLNQIPSIENQTIVDAGCGLGDMYGYMKEYKIVPKEYIGIDVHETMVKKARKYTKQMIVHANILKESLPLADYYVCSGAMNVLQRFETILFIQQMLKYSTKGVVFNLLKGTDSSPTYNKFLPSELYEMVQPLNVDIELIEGYLEGDFTVALCKAYL